MVFEEITLSTAYLPPAQYFALITVAGKVNIEMHENYIRQSYRNRCIIAGPNGRHALVVPVLHGESAKSPITETCIDYSKRWIPVHLRAMEAAYRNSPFYQFYADAIFSVISGEHKYLVELNSKLLDTLLSLLAIDRKIEYTGSYKKPSGLENDYRYSITPKKSAGASAAKLPPYQQVFSERHGFISDLSITDLLFNLGPRSPEYLEGAFI
jgi:hypothetical protein